MKREELKYVSSTRKRMDNSVNATITYYNTFITSEGKRLVLKDNKVCSRFGEFIDGEIYTFLIEYGTCWAVSYKNRLVFCWAGNIIMRENGVYKDVSYKPKKKPLTKEKIEAYVQKFFEKNKIPL
jgi:hypothetical protein